jgi:hypothetical protein
MLSNARSGVHRQYGHDPSRMERGDHFFVMVGQLLDDAMIGGLEVRLTLTDGSVVEGVPVTPASDPASTDELDGTGYPHSIDLAGTRVELDAVRQAMISYPGSDG